MTAVKSFIVQASGAGIIKLITAMINSVALKSSVFVNASKKWLTIAKALAYPKGLITAVKVLWYRPDPGPNVLENYAAVIYESS